MMIKAFSVFALAAALIGGAVTYGTGGAAAATGDKAGCCVANCCEGCPDCKCTCACCDDCTTGCECSCDS